MSAAAPAAEIRGIRPPAIAALLTILALLLAGCASTRVDWLTEVRPAAPRPTPQVELLEATPEHPYRELAWIEISDGGWRQSRERMRQRLLEAAAGLGADAVILQHSGTRLGVSPAPQGLTLHDRRILLGLAIAYEER